jgi:hypothetical protein
MTEFASPRYFDKLKSLNETTDNASTPTLPEAGPALSATITLPLGNPRPPTGRRRRSDDNVRPSDQKRRSLGHDPTSLRAQRKPSLIFGFKKRYRKQKGLAPVSEPEGYISEEEVDEPCIQQQ